MVEDVFLCVESFHLDLFGQIVSSAHDAGRLWEMSETDRQTWNRSCFWRQTLTKTVYIGGRGHVGGRNKSFGGRVETGRLAVDFCMQNNYLPAYSLVAFAVFPGLSWKLGRCQFTWKTVWLTYLRQGGLPLGKKR